MNNLTTGVLAALLLASPIAGAETEYPAADFQPKVLYKDAEYKHAESASAEKSKPATAETAQPDERYPAATFKPEVVYQDTEYKHTQSAPVAPTSKSKPAAPKSVSTEESKSTGAAATTEKKEEKSMTNYLLGLGAFAVAGLFFFGRKPKAPAEKTYPVYTRDTTSGLTGVEKYLKEQEVASATGVTKYLERQTESEEVAEAATPATGVAKYLDKKEEESATGVEKYLRNLG
ncbi:MAG: hypothetical protein M8364_16475 [Methylobacter sp.]|uniref:hypothetical protein n=1 Tax=Methylobacter sp. TaxID=2051955 RepID=UPI00258C260C|nr:hypothetical protein [Methylobacter sp.]MCL7422487.1 hypothetical protein [Methylobacter sp.]